MFWIIVVLVALALTIVVPARRDHECQRETFAAWWARHVPRLRQATTRRVALHALAAHSNTIWWLALLAAPYARATLIALWWTARLIARIAGGLLHAALKLFYRALPVAIYLLARLWQATKWLIWHIDQLTVPPTPSNAPQLAT
ncbi:hypothetical protein [Nonomuraea glycinis]|uniref:hypothetical protein n=1 Tax=Nonomuraea glycinis TaxID=2047744 RepID=UPI0033B0C079